MENATKALIVAGEVLISLLIISLAIFLFSYYSGLSEESEERRQEQQLVQYNLKFEKYVDKTLAMQDVVTIANLARDYNNNKFSDEITVYFKGVDVTDKEDDYWIEKLQKDENNEYWIEKLEKYDAGTIKEIRIISKK